MTATPVRITAALALAFAVMPAAQAAGARCERALSAAARSAGLAVEDVVASDCRAWPFNPAIDVLAVALDPEHGRREPGERALRLVVAQVANGADIQAQQHSVLEEDALLVVGEESLRLDTARYDLAPGIRAFGVVVNSLSPGAACPDRKWDDELTLYARDGKALRPVFATWRWVSQGNSRDMCREPGEAEHFASADITLSMGAGVSHGYADIVAHARIDAYEGDTQLPARTVSKVFHYDGRTYATDPSATSFFWARPN